MSSCDSEREERKSHGAISSGPGSTVIDKSFIQEGGGFLLTCLISLSLSLSFWLTLSRSLYISLLRAYFQLNSICLSLSRSLSLALSIYLSCTLTLLYCPRSVFPPSLLSLSLNRIFAAQWRTALNGLPPAHRSWAPSLLDYSGSFCVEFGCSPSAHMGFLHKRALM